VDDIIAALEKIKEQGSFCGKRATSTNNLHLEIKKFGLLKFPLAASKVKSLIKLAKPAKFGWRDQTLLDKEVRDAWEISKSKIKIESSRWNKELEPVLDHLKKDIGLSENAKLKASLHNLLIYEPGQFFSSHQDSEKLDGMVASLVIVLPSRHSGGSLIIEHHGDKKQFKTSQFPLDKLTYIAFYADCHHEVKAIKEGYRVVLTYNLVLENQTTHIHAPSSVQPHNDLIQNLRSYFSEKSNPKETSAREKSVPQKLIYLLDHSYTQNGLSWNHLKNGDNLRASALKEAANALNLNIYMALADVQETWDCEDDYNNSRYRSRRRYYEDEEEYNQNEIQVNDLIDSSTTLKHWLDLENKSLNYKECHVSDSDICWTKATDEFEPFESNHEGWMGNYGNTMERWYHRAAIILWKKEDHYPVLFEMDPVSVIDELLKLTKKKSQEIYVRQIVTALLPYWSQYMQRSKELSLISTVLKLAVYVNEQKLAHDMVKDFDIRALDPETTMLFLALVNAYGINWCLSVLKEWVKVKNYGRSLKCEKISKIISDLSEKQSKNNELTNWILIYQLEKLKEHHIYDKKHDTRLQLIKNTNERIKEIMDFIKACMIVDSDTIHANTINHIVDNIELYPVLDLVSVLHFLKKNLNDYNVENWGYKKLFDYVVNALQQERDQGLRNADDWSIKEKAPCTCQDCLILYDFLRSSTEKTKIWPLAEARRDHIQQKMSGLGVPVTHQTERKGSPYRLVLAKTDKLYQQAKHRFERIEADLRDLIKEVDV